MSFALLLPTVCSLCLLLSDLPALVDCQPEIRSFSCDTRTLTEADHRRRVMTQQITDYRRSRLFSASALTTVPVCFFLITDSNGRNNRSDAILQGQLDHLNTAFSANSCCNVEQNDWCDSNTTCSVETGFRFAWAKLDENEGIVENTTVSNIVDPGACVFRIQNAHWFRLGLIGIRSRQMRRSLRKGGPETLNVYLSKCRSVGVGGYATFPFDFHKSPRTDGVVLTVDALRGTGFRFFNLGNILVHEVGHWLGLLHTFDGGCTRSDGVTDTPKTAIPFRGCGDEEGFEIGRDTCPEAPGSDPINNFMDYSYDRCRFLFTPGQAQLMKANYDIYRLNSKQDRGVVSLFNAVPSGALFLPPGQHQIYSFESNSSARCATSATESQYGLYLKWGRPPYFRRFFDNCVSKSWRKTDESCTARFRFGRKKLYAGVQTSSFHGVQNLTITCWEI